MPLGPRNRGDFAGLSPVGDSAPIHRSIELPSHGRIATPDLYFLVEGAPVVVKEAALGSAVLPSRS